MAEPTSCDDQNTVANRLEITRGFGHCRLAGSGAKLPLNGFVGLPKSTRLIDKIGRKKSTDGIGRLIGKTATNKKRL
jgi:hypothetical protein